MRFAIRSALTCSIMLLSIFASILQAGEGDKTKTPAKTKLGIILSKETTYITGPVNKDGTVNYVAYINTKYSEGVTVDNNAAIEMIRALGPEIIVKSVRERTFKALKLKSLPEKGKYFVPLNKFLKNRNLDYEQIEGIEDNLRDALERPWKAKELPQIAAWIKANEAPLKILIAGSKKPRYYMPLLPPQIPSRIPISSCRG